MDDVRQMIWDYLREQLDAVYMEVTREHWVNDVAGDRHQKAAVGRRG
jgi:hypothetical protein